MKNLTWQKVLIKLLPLLTLVALVVFWQAWVEINDTPRYLLPSPTDVFTATQENWSRLLFHSRVTLVETLLGFGLSVAVGVPLAVAIVYSKWVENMLYPLLVGSQAIPKIAIAPLLLVWLGFGMTSKVLVAFLIAFFPVVVATATGLRGVSEDTLRLVESMGASTWQVSPSRAVSNLGSEHAGRVQGCDSAGGGRRGGRRVRRGECGAGSLRVGRRRQLQNAAAVRSCGCADLHGRRAVLPAGHHRDPAEPMGSGRSRRQRRVHGSPHEHSGDGSPGRRLRRPAAHTRGLAGAGADRHLLADATELQPRHGSQGRRGPMADEKGDSRSRQSRDWVHRLRGGHGNGPALVLCVFGLHPSRAARRPGHRQPPGTPWHSFKPDVPQRRNWS